MSQPGDVPAKTDADGETASPDESTATGEEVGEAVVLPSTGVSGSSSANDMLCTSQTLDDEPLTPEVVAPPTAVVTPRSVGLERCFSTTRYRLGTLVARFQQQRF